MKTTTTPKVSDEALTKATGRDWKDWCRLLDGEKAHTLKHAEIARLVHEKFGGGNWWSQMIAVGYEQLRGLRVVHQKSDGFEVSKSKTIAAPVNTVYRAFESPARRSKWLADPDISISTAKEGKLVRFAWVDGKSRVAAHFTSKGEKTAVTVQHLKLANATAAARMKKYWGAQLDTLADYLGAV